MAVAGLAEEMPKFRAADITEDRRRYRRRFLVKTDSRFDGPPVVVQAPGLPTLGEAYATESGVDPFAKAVALLPVESEGSWTTWYVDVEYDTETEEEDPLDEPPLIDIDFETEQIPVPGSVQETYAPGEGLIPGDHYSPIVNSADEPFDPPPTMPKSRAIVTITRNEPEFDLSVVRQYINTVNQDAWANCEPGQCLMRGIRSSQQYKEGRTENDPPIFFWRTTYTIVIDPEGWKLVLLDAGNYYYPVDGNGNREPGYKPVAFRDAALGNPIVGLLSGPGQGGAKGGGQLPEGEDPKWLEFEIYGKSTFADLDLPQDFNTEGKARKRSEADKGKKRA
jgi:hypothetical protein